jgi:hypothetical protein
MSCTEACVNSLNSLTAPANSASANEDKLESVPAKDDDPDGLKLVSCSDPLERAAKCLNPLKTLARQNIDVWIAVYDVAIRRSESPARCAAGVDLIDFFGIREVRTGRASAPSSAAVGR